MNFEMRCINLSKRSITTITGYPVIKYTKLINSQLIHNLYFSLIIRKNNDKIYDVNVPALAFLFNFSES